MRKWLGRIAALALCCVVVTGGFCSCKKQKQDVVVWTSTEEFCIQIMRDLFRESLPDVNVVVDYKTTGNYVAKLLAEGKDAECDIIDCLEFNYFLKLEKENLLGDLSSIKKPEYDESLLISEKFLPQNRSSGTIALNTKVLEQKGLEEPKSYKDLLKPEYKGLISMPNPKSSTTGYMFLLALANAWGEDEAFEYFDALAPNVLSFTTSGLGPINALVQGEAAIGLAMTGQTVREINKGQPLKMVFFDEGSPYLLYGTSILSGREKKPGVKEAYELLVNDYNYAKCEQYFPENPFKDKTYEIENYPKDIVYSDMSGNTLERKEHLLDRWKY